MFVAIPDSWRVSLLFSSVTALRHAVMTFGVLDTSTHNTARAVDVAEGFKAWWTAQLKTVVSHEWQLDSIRVLDQESETGPSVQFTSGLPNVGAVSGDAGPGQAAVITTFLTGERGRRNRGRSYLVGPPASYFAAGDGTSIEAASATVIQDVYIALNAAINAEASGAVHAILSKADVAAKPVLAYKTRQYLGTQRRRVRPT